MPETKYIARRSGLFASLMQATELAGFRLETLAPVSLRDVYYDTPAGDLLRQGYALRVREQDRTAMAQLRTLRVPEGARAREADAFLEPPVWGDTLPELPAGPLREMLELLSGDAPLNAMLRLRQFRSPRVAYDGPRLVGVISLDVVGYELPTRLHVANEIEIELAGTGRESDLYRLDPVLRASGVEPTVRSKFERGVLRLQRGAEDPILLLPSERAALERMLEAPDPALRRRARVVLLAARGLKEETVSARAGLSPSRVKHWVQRFREGRVTGLRTSEAEPSQLSVAASAPPADPPAFRVSEIVSRGVPTAAVFRAEHFDPAADPGFGVERSREEREDGAFEVRGDGAAGDGAAGAPPRDPDPSRMHGFDAPGPPPLTFIPVEPVEPADEETAPPHVEPPAQDDFRDASATEVTEEPASEEGPADGEPAPAITTSVPETIGEREPEQPVAEPVAPAMESPPRLQRPTEHAETPAPAVPARPRLRADTPVLHAAEDVLRYHYACFLTAGQEVLGGGPHAARRALLSAHRVRLSLETFAEFLPESTVERLHDRLRSVARALDVLVDHDAALEQLARAALAGEGDAGAEAHRAMVVRREKAHRRVAARLSAGRHTQWTRRMERLLAMLAERRQSGRLDAGFFREPPDDYVARRRRPRRVRLRHMLASTLWRRYEDIRAYETVVDAAASDERLRPLGVGCAALEFVLGLAADSAPAPARDAVRLLGELEAVLASLHRASSSIVLIGRAGAAGDIVAETEAAREQALAALPAAWSAVAGEDFRRRLGEVAAAG